MSTEVVPQITTTPEIASVVKEIVPTPAQQPPAIRAPNHPNEALAFAVPPELVELVAARAAEMVAERQPAADHDGWLRGADKIANYIDSPRSRVYALVSARRIPVHRDGSALIARRSELDAWLLAGGALRP